MIENSKQNELRERFIRRLKRDKQTYICEVTGLCYKVLCNFKKGDIDLYPNLAQKLTDYLDGKYDEEVW